MSLPRDTQLSPADCATVRELLKIAVHTLRAMSANGARTPGAVYIYRRWLRKAKDLDRKLPRLDS